MLQVLKDVEECYFYNFSGIGLVKGFKKCIFESASFIKVNVVLISFGAIGSKLNFDGN